MPHKDVYVVLLILAVIAFALAAALSHRWAHWPALVAAGLALWALENLLILTWT